MYDMRRRREKDEKEKVIESRKIKRGADKFQNINLRLRRLRKTLLIMLIVLIVLYFALKVAYDTGRFTVVLDSSSDMKASLVMYASKNEKLTRRTLKADALDFITNISGEWIPENINDEADGRT